jgi:hypothetical protein
MMTYSQILRPCLGGMLIAIASATQAVAQAPASACSTVAYRGFDSRLQVEAVGRVVTQGERITGFEMSNGRPVVAFERRLVAIDGERQFVMPSIDVIETLAVDAEGGLWIQQGGRLRRVAKEKLETVRPLSAAVRLYNSGHTLFLESETQGNATRLTVRTADERGALPPFHIEGGTAVAVSFSTLGIAAVVGDSLLAWSPGAKNVTTLRRDSGLRFARDVALIAPQRAVIALPNTLALITDRGATILAFLKARVRWSNGALYVLDEQWGLIWKLTGIEQIGTPGADKAHATKLLKQLPQGASETDVNFLEAARLVGCEGARGMRKKR